MKVSSAQKILERLFQDNIMTVASEPHFQELLTAYIELELAGQAAAEAYPQVHSQIMANLAIREAYEELRELFQQEQTNSWLEPSLIATFYTQLQAPGSTPTPAQQVAVGITWLLDKSDRLLIKLSTEFIEKLVWMPSAQPFAKALNPVAPQLLVSVTSPPEIESVMAMLQIREGQSATHCDVIVKLSIPGRTTLQQAGVEVIATGAGVTRQRRRTDGFGKVIFKEIEWRALETLSLEIQLQ